jgi:hypothetical protein
MRGPDQLAPQRFAAVALPPPPASPSPGVSTFWSWGGSAAEPSTFICGGADVATPVAAAWMNGRKSSIGIGKIVVEVCSAAISVAVCR